MTALSFDITLFVFGAQFASISGSPFVVIEVFGVAPERFSLLAPRMVFFFGLGLVSPNATAAALQPMGRRAGVASALLGVFQMAGGALAGWAVSALYDRSARPMALTVAVLGSVARLIHMSFLRRPRVDAV